GQVVDTARSWFGLPATQPMAAWPVPVVTDADGRFTLHLLGAGWSLTCFARGGRFPTQVIEILNDERRPDGETFSLTSGTVVEGRAPPHRRDSPAPRCAASRHGHRGSFGQACGRRLRRASSPAQQQSFLPRRLSTLRISALPSRS